MVYAETKNKQTRKWHHAGMSHQCLWGTQKSAGNRAGGSTNSRLCESVYIFREKKTRRVDVLMSSDWLLHSIREDAARVPDFGRGFRTGGERGRIPWGQSRSGTERRLRRKKQVKRWRLSRDLTVFGDWDAQDFNYSEVSFLWGWLVLISSHNPRRSRVPTHSTAVSQGKWALSRRYLIG